MTAANDANPFASSRSVLARMPSAFANIRTRNGSTTATGIPEAAKLRCTSRCHLPVASVTISARSKRVSQRLSWRIPWQLLHTRNRSLPGNTWISSQCLLTSIPTLDFALVSCSDASFALHAGRAPYHLLRTRAEGRTDHAPPRCQTPWGISGPGHPRRGRNGHRPRRTVQLALIRSAQHARGLLNESRGPNPSPQPSPYGRGSRTESAS